MTDILGIGSSGLTAYRKLLETTGNNIANANTEGYVRRDVVLQSVGEAQMLPTARLASSGSGVSVSLIRRASDAFLQAQVRAATARQAQSEVVSDGLVRIEKAVIAPANTVGTAVQDFYAKAQDLSVSPASTTARLALIDAGERVAESFRAAANSVTSEIASADTSLKSSIEAVNSLATQIARLNLDISRTGKGQQKLNDLLDQRDVLLNDLSKLVNFTIVEEESGSVDVYLGDAASGPKLVELGTSRMLGSTKDGEKTELIFDPYGNANVTNQVTGGAIAGLIEFQKTARGFLENLDQLATGFTAAINTQHRQGLDLNGRQGANMFSAEGLEAVAFAANRGKAKIAISIDGATQINSAAYEAKYAAQAGTWTLKSQSTGASVTGKMPLTLEGVTFSSEGIPEDGDTFSVEPLKNASAAMRFVLSDPASIAAAQSIYVDPAYTNVGKGTLSVLRSDVPVSAPPIASMLDLFKPNGTDTLGFRTDGVTFTIPAGAKDVTLSSLGTLSSLVFSASASDIASLTQGGVVKLSLKIDGTTQLLTINPQEATPAGIAAAINDAAKTNFSKSFAASVSEGRIVISALNGHTVSTGTINGSDGAGRTQSFAATEQPASGASNIVVFTREGVQISGPPLDAQDYSKWLTVANGFLPTATYSYRPDASVPGTYRNLPIAGTSAPLAAVVSSSSVLSFDVTADPNLESAATSQSGAFRTGAIYALDLQGLPSIRLSGDETAGLNADDVADRLMASLNDFATGQYWTGDAINFGSTTQDNFNFTVTINGDDYAINFARSRNDRGQLLDSGTFTVAGPQALTVSLVESNGAKRIAIALPKSLDTGSTTLAVTAGADAKTLGIADGNTNKLTANLAAAGSLSSAALLAGRTLSFSVAGQANPATAQIQGTSGTTDLKVDGQTIGQLSWSIVDGKLQIASNVSTLQVVSRNATDRQSAIDLGFLGTDLTAAKVNGLFASAVPQANALNGTNLTVRIDGEDHVIRIFNKNGSATADQSGRAIAPVTWSEVDGKLVLESVTEPFQIVADTEEQVQAAAKLGFPTGNAAMLGTTTRLRISSLISSAADNLGSVAASASPAGARLTIGYASEDLIVGLRSNGVSDPARTLSVRYPPETERKQPEIPDFSVVIDSLSQLRIVKFDPNDSSKILETYAVRSWTPREPVEWLGMQFSIDGAVVAGDRYNITQGEERSGDNRNALALAKLQASDIFGKNQGSFQDVYASVSTKLGTSSQSAANDATTAKDAATNLQLAFDGKTGVDLDREASDLIRYQQAYQAAAQVVKSARDMFDTILRIF